MKGENIKIGMGIAVVMVLLTASVLGYILLRDDPDNNNGVNDLVVGDWTGPYLDERNATSDGVDDVVEANNQFGIDMLKALRETEEGNIFISPYSIFTALSMTYEGARGNTADEMADVLHLPDNDQERLGSFAKVQNDINKGSDQYELATANAIWPMKGPEWYTEFLNTITSYYDGKVEELDYASDPESCRKTINDWVENRTNDRIEDLIPQGFIDTLTYMVLTNAIYFKGEWIYDFNENDTKKATFHSPGGDVEVDMMGMKLEDDNKIPYYLGDGVQALELPYKGDELSMVLVLPNSGTLDDLISDLDNALLEAIRNGLEPSNVKVKMPKLKLETKYELKDPLIDLGMPTAFIPGSADFSGMSAEGEGVYISAVIHQTFLEIDEKGTEAAAATAVILRNFSAEPSMPEFTADRPFLFYIQQKDTGNILFMGTMKDPTA